MLKKILLCLITVLLLSGFASGKNEEKVIAWHETFEGTFTVSPEAGQDGRIYFTVYNNYYSLSPATGKVLWEKVLTFTPQKQILLNNYAYLTDDYKKIALVSLKDGSLLWEYNFDDKEFKKKGLYNFDKFTGHNDYFFVSLRDTGVICYRKNTKEKLWFAPFKNYNLIDTEIKGETCFLLINDGSKDGYKLQEVDLNTGKLTKEYNLSKTIGKGYPYFYFYNKNLVIFISEKNTGIKIFSLKNWDFTESHSVDFTKFEFAADNTFFYVNPEQTLCFIKKGKKWKNKDTNPKFFGDFSGYASTCVCHKNMIYYISGVNNEGICAVNTDSNEIVWKKEYKGKFFNSGLNMSDNILYCITSEGEILILDMMTGEEISTPLNAGYTNSSKIFIVADNVIIYTHDSILSVGDKKLSSHHFHGPPGFNLYTDHYYARGAKAYFAGSNIDYVDWKAYRVKNFKIEKGKYAYDKHEILKNKPDFEGTFYFPCGSGWRDKTVELPMEESGIYLIKATGRGVTGKNEAVSEAIISQTGSVVKFTPNEILVFANNLKENTPQKGASVKIYLNNKIIKEGITDNNGIYKADFKEPLSGDMTVFTEYKGNYTLYSSKNSEIQTRYQAYVYTDRPIYRPGHTVYFKGILRKDLGETYSNLSHKGIKLEIFDSTGKSVYKGKPLTNDFGSFSGKFNIPYSASTGNYNIVTTINDRVSYYANFSVEEYRKPEYRVSLTPGKKSYIQGRDASVELQADYYFGSPVGGATVYYTVRSSYYKFSFDRVSNEESWYRDDSGTYYYSYPDEVIMEKTAKTDIRGRLTINIPLKKKDSDRLYTIEASVIDLSRRKVKSSTSFIATRGEYFLGVSLEKKVYNTGEEVNVMVKGEDIFNHPVSKEVKLDFCWRKWKEVSKIYVTEAFHSENIKLDEKGMGNFTLKLPSEIPSDKLVVTAKGTDSYGNVISSSDSSWISGSDYGGDYPSLDIITDKNLYSPGDTAKILINSSNLLEPKYALVCVERNKIEDYEVIKLDKKSSSIEIPIKENYGPNVYLTVCFMSKGDLIRGTKLIAVPAKDKFINLSVTTDKEKYLPGEEAIFTIKTTDVSGNPLKSEVSLGLVDEAIYAIKAENTQDIRKFFYGKKENYVMTGFSIPQELSAGGIQKVPQNLKVREDFKDTAYWAPTIVTDDRGEAHVKIKLPDNLTTWRATLRAVTKDTLVGGTVSKSVVSKKLLLRLETPRFIAQKDSVCISGVIHNNIEKDMKIRAFIESEGPLLQGENEKIVNVTAKGSVLVDWTFKADKLPDNKKAIFTAYAISVDEPEEYSDAVKLSVPVLPHGQEFIETESGKIKGRYVKILTIPADTIDESKELEINFTPSITGSMFKSLDYLTSYPYGCVEQTMSCFLPDIFVWRTMKQLGIKNREMEEKIPDMVGKGLDKLYGFQNYDGGWGWWKDDKTNPCLTALVVYGLSEAKEAGFTVNDYVMSRGIDAIYGLNNNLLYEISSLKAEKERTEAKIEHLKKRGKDSEAENLSVKISSIDSSIIDIQNTRAYLMFSAVMAGDRQVMPQMDEMFKIRHILNYYTKSLLSLSYHETGDDKKAAVILSEITSEGKVIKDTCHWEGNIWHYGWFDNTVETTSWVLKAMIAVDPGNEKIDKTVKWLIENRNGGYYWSSTKDTASVIYAMSDYLCKSRELSPDYNVKVYLNDEKLCEFNAGKDDIGKNFIITTEERKEDTDRKIFKISKDKLRKDKPNKIEIIRQGEGEVYYSLYMSTYGYADKLSSQDAGFTVKKEYFVKMPSSKESFRPVNTLYPLNWDVISGKQFKVKITVDGKPDYQYIMIEDYIPAGCEIVGDADDSKWLKGYYSRRENRDNRVVFFLNDLYYTNGHGEIVYTLRAETPGIFHALPAHVEMMYNPHIKGNSDERVLVIKDK
jgi:uncharacterized protein YfaS (alpha-2-macroglobulin family)